MTKHATATPDKPLELFHTLSHYTLDVLCRCSLRWVAGTRNFPGASSCGTARYMVHRLVTASTCHMLHISPPSPA